MFHVSRFETFIREQMAAAQVPGLAISVVYHDDILYARGFGVTSVEEGGVPVTPDTVFRIGSVTKPLTGVAIVRLVERGVLALDAPISQIVPWLAFSDGSHGESITLRMLLSHTSGLSNSGEESGRRDAGALEEYVRHTLPSVGLVAPPGTLYSYSNAGAILAGFLAQTAAGKPFVELVQEEVFAPLGMARTTLDVTVAMTYPLAQAHDVGEDGALHTRHRFADNLAHAPAGFAMSTASDIAVLMRMLLAAGERQGQAYLSAETVAEMTRPQVRTFAGPGGGYGLTFGVGRYQGRRRFGHRGMIGTFGAHMELLPDDGLGVFIVMNRVDDRLNSEVLFRRLADEILDLPPATPPQSVAPDRDLWPRFEGVYLGGMVGLLEVEARGDALILRAGEDAIDLVPLDTDIYVGQSPTLGMRLSVGFILQREEPAPYVVVNGSPAARTDERITEGDPQEWGPYEGVYASFDRVTVRVHDGALWVQSARFPREVRCLPLGPDRFTCPLGVLEFQRGSSGAAAALLLGGAFSFPRAE